MVHFITWEVHVFSNQFPIAREKSANPNEWGNPGNLSPILLHSIGTFSHKILFLWYTP